MMNTQLLNRPGLAAIAAATALLSTPALAQDVAPVTADPAPIVADEPLPAEPTTTTDAVADPLAPAATSTSTRATRAPRPNRATATPVSRAPAPAARVTAPDSTATATATPAAPVEQATPSVDPAMVAPLPEPVAPAPVTPTSEALVDGDLLPIAGAAGLGILALAGAGFAMRRRRRHDEDAMVEDNWHEPAMKRPASIVSEQPVVASAPIAASAFNWGSTPHQSAPTHAPVNRIEAAKRGPTPDNPSLSLKKRLKRAAFFDQRDRQIAAGMAAPVPSTAGLPERRAQSPTPKRQPATSPAHGLSMSFGKTFQPA